MLHHAGQIQTSIQRRQEVNGATGWNRTIGLDLRLWLVTHDALLTVSNMPGYSCCRGNTVCRAVDLRELFTISPLGAGVDGDVSSSCEEKRSESRGCEVFRWRSSSNLRCLHVGQMCPLLIHRLICWTYHKEGALCFCSLAPQMPGDLSHTLQWAPRASRQGGEKLPWQSGFHYEKWNWTKRLRTHPLVEARTRWLQEQHQLLSTQSPGVHLQSANQLVWWEELRRSVERRFHVNITYDAGNPPREKHSHIHLPGRVTWGWTVMLICSVAFRWW